MRPMFLRLLWFLGAVILAAGGLLSMAMAALSWGRWEAVLYLAAAGLQGALLLSLAQMRLPGRRRNV